MLFSLLLYFLAGVCIAWYTDSHLTFILFLKVLYVTQGSHISIILRLCIL